MRLRILLGSAPLVLLLAVIPLTACEPEADLRSGSSGSGSVSAPAADAGNAPQGGSVSASHVQGPEGVVDVSDPLEAYSLAVAELAAAREATGSDAFAALQHIANARAAYREMFEDSSRELDEETHSLITSAFAEAEKGARRGKPHRVALAEQTIGSSLVRVAFMNLESALGSGDGARISSWFPVLLKHAEGNGVSHLSPRVEAVAANPSEPELDAVRDAVLTDLLSHFADKVREETVEVLASLEAGKTAAAVEEATEAIGYYGIIQPDLRASLGEEAESELAGRLDDLLGQSADGDLQEARGTAQEIARLLGEYQDTIGPAQVSNEE